jgi:hypothetical protein
MMLLLGSPLSPARNVLRFGVSDAMPARAPRPVAPRTAAPRWPPVADMRARRCTCDLCIAR